MEALAVPARHAALLERLQRRERDVFLAEDFIRPIGELVQRLGAPADVAIFDPRAPLRVVPEMLKSQGKNTPFTGYELEGRVRTTIVAGRVVYEA